MQGRHCPFLNRNDSRCAKHFSVNRLQHAFDHCFNDYGGCPSYREMLNERNGRGAEGSSPAVVTITIHGRHASNFRQLRHCGHQVAVANRATAA